MNQTWVPAFDEDDFNKRMDNAFRRVAGSIGFDLSRDRGNTRALRETAAGALETGLDHSQGPLFMRLGKSALNLGGYSPGESVDLRACAGEILREFFTEGKTAFHAAQAALHTEARSYLQACGMDADCCVTVLSAADSTFTLPSKDAFSEEALALCKEGMAPLTKAMLTGALAAFAVIALLRSPVLAGIVGVLVCGTAYYFARGRQRARAEYILRTLPKRLYSLLHAGLQSNVRRYAETVNAALAARSAA